MAKIKYDYTKSKYAYTKGSTQMVQRLIWYNYGNTMMIAEGPDHFCQ